MEAGDNKISLFSLCCPWLDLGCEGTNRGWFAGAVGWSVDGLLSVCMGCCVGAVALVAAYIGWVAFMGSEAAHMGRARAYTGAEGGGTDGSNGAAYG